MAHTHNSLQTCPPLLLPLGGPCSPLAVPLSALRCPVRGGALCAALISPEVDRMHLALRVCTSCDLPPAPVFAAWALALLCVGRLAEARVKVALFVQACTPPITHA
jgi:hypothetical protein